MKKPTKRLLMGFLIAFVVGFALLNILAYNHAYAMMYFTSGGTRTEKPEKLTLGQRIKVLLMGVNVPRPASSRQPSELDPECRPLTIRGTNGITLGCWYVDRGEKTPLVILFHGYGAEKTCLLREAKVFLQLRMSVLLVDFRGSGESSEFYTTIGFREADDVTTVLQHARLNLHHLSVVLYGQSMGAVSILRAVHQGGIQPDGVIVEAVFDTMLNTVRNRFHSMGVPSFPSAELLVFWGGVLTGFNAFDHNPVAYAKDVTCPALFMHGTDDPRARIEEGRRVFAAVLGVKQFKEFPSIGHAAYVSRYPGEWTETVGAFLKEAVDKRQP